jgi:predicted metal-dependent enzyme (double-stranded beta helix superfamily)
MATVLEAAPQAAVEPEVITPAATAMHDFVGRVREAFESETTIDRMLASTERALKNLLARSDCLDGLTINRQEFRSWKVYVDPDHLFCIHVSHQKPVYRRGVHDHGELGWAVYGVHQGEIIQQLYKREDDGSEPGKATLRPLPEIVQRAGDAVVVPVSGSHAPRNESGVEAWAVVIRSRELSTIWRNFYNVEKGTVTRIRKGSD